MPRRKNHAAAAARAVIDAEKKLKIMRQWIAAQREAAELHDFLAARAFSARVRRQNMLRSQEERRGA